MEGKLTHNQLTRLDLESSPSLNKLNFLDSGPSLSDIEVELKAVTDYYQLGLHLEVSREALKKIEENYPKVERRKSEVISYWKDNFEDCSWEALANAVEKMEGHANLVRRLRALGNQQGNDTSNASQISEQGIVFSLVLVLFDCSIKLLYTYIIRYGSSKQ